MDKSIKLRTIGDFFDLQVDLYILGDLKKLMNIKEDEQGSSLCTIPAAMTIIAAMEMFGTFITKDPNIDDSRAYLAKFMEVYIPAISKGDRSSIIFNYRHKMMHIFFPKVDWPKLYGVTKKPNSNELIDRTKINRRVLNVPLLYILFLSGVDKLKHEIFSDKKDDLIEIFYENISAPTSSVSSTTTTETTSMPE